MPLFLLSSRNAHTVFMFNESDTVEAVGGFPAQDSLLAWQNAKLQETFSQCSQRLIPCFINMVSTRRKPKVRWTPTSPASRTSDKGKLDPASNYGLAFSSLFRGKNSVACTSKDLNLKTRLSGFESRPMVGRLLIFPAFSKKQAVDWIAQLCLLVEANRWIPKISLPPDWSHRARSRSVNDLKELVKNQSL